MVSNLATVLATFLKNWAFFSKSSGHPGHNHRDRTIFYSSFEHAKLG
jgi:hypothetical protein